MQIVTLKVTAAVKLFHTTMVKLVAWEPFTLTRPRMLPHSATLVVATRLHATAQILISCLHYLTKIVVSFKPRFNSQVRCLLFSTDLLGSNHQAGMDGLYHWMKQRSNWHKLLF